MLHAVHANAAWHPVVCAAFIAVGTGLSDLIGKYHVFDADD